MDNYERIITYGLAPIVALFTLYKTQYLPWRIRQNEQLFNHEMQASDSTRDYYQKREANAFSQTLSINEQLVQVLIDISDKKMTELNARIDSHEKIFYAIQQHMARGNSAIDTANRERVQMAEQTSDIDIELHTIKELLRVAIRSNNSTLTHD